MLSDQNLLVSRGGNFNYIRGIKYSAISIDEERLYFLLIIVIIFPFDELNTFASNEVNLEIIEYPVQTLHCLLRKNRLLFLYKSNLIKWEIKFTPQENLKKCFDLQFTIRSEFKLNKNPKIYYRRMAHVTVGVARYITLTAQWL